MTARRLMFAAALAAALVALPVAASADPSSRTIEGEHLRIVSTLDHEAAGSLANGERIGWTLEVSADAPSPGRIDVLLEGRGELAVKVAVSRCEVAWQDGVCAAGETVLHPAAPGPLDGSRVHLVSAAASGVAHLHVTVEAPDPVPQNASTDIRIVAEGFGEEIDSGPPDPSEPPDDEPASPPDDDEDDLAVTGADLSWSGGLGLAAVLCGIGTALLARRRTRGGAQ
ncbi:hypothetical protein [Microbacterium sp. G2-8]|uniref:hypothetical protein n=1 Tax=Microbacterium sp. G2-8 TaxID=2842454 RepID=UPI001C8A8C30|nr:hypothetical protein [Microbacterium sp. G2-8]